VNKKINKTICFLCDKKFTLLDVLTFNIEYTFLGYSHKRNCLFGVSKI
jgi:hypothetical protein